MEHDIWQVRKALLQLARCSVEQENVVVLDPAADRHGAPIGRHGDRKGLAFVGVADTNRQPQDPQKLPVRQRPYPRGLVVRGCRREAVRRIGSDTSDNCAVLPGFDTQDWFVRGGRAHLRPSRSREMYGRRKHGERR